MLNTVLDAVTNKLDSLFPDVTIYTDAVEQGLIEPCFFVGFLEPSEKSMIGQRCFRRFNMSIQYLPGNVEQISRELNRVADALLDGMEWITLANGDMLKGNNKSCHCEDGVLTFLVDYNMFVIRKKEEIESMEGIEIGTELMERNGE